MSHQINTYPQNFPLIPSPPSASPRPLPPPPSLPSTPSDALARTSDPTASIRLGPAVPHAVTEYRGFAAQAVAGVFLGLFLSWAVLPQRLLVAIGVHYYPSRWWAVAVPAWILVAMGYLYVFVGLCATERLTPHLADLRAVVDDAAVVVGSCGGDTLHGKIHDFTHLPTSAVCDLPLAHINDVLYGKHPSESNRSH